MTLAMVEVAKSLESLCTSFVLLFCISTLMVDHGEPLQKLEPRFNARVHFISSPSRG